MDADEILLRNAQVEKIDNVARRTFGLDTPAAGVEKGFFVETFEPACEPVAETLHPLVPVAGHIQPFGFTPR
jgi:hypothetical protein